MSDIKPCEKCKGNRWKTLVKGKKWQCRKCGEIRRIEGLNDQKRKEDR